jgi:hypothetical protein
MENISMSSEYNKAISDFTAFVESFNISYQAPPLKGSFDEIGKRAQDYGNYIGRVARDSNITAKELMKSISNPDEQESFKSAVVPILEKGMMSLVERDTKDFG